MKPFLMLGIRAEEVAADDEYAAMLRCTGLDDGCNGSDRTSPAGKC